MITKYSVQKQSFCEEEKDTRELKESALETLMTNSVYVVNEKLQVREQNRKDYVKSRRNGKLRKHGLKYRAVGRQSVK